MKECQLEDLPEAGASIGPAEGLLVRTAKRVERLSGGRLRLPIFAVDAARALDPAPVAPRPRPPPLRLQPGEHVRVRSLVEIRRTLDARERCAGLGFMPAMLPYLGRTFVVKKRIDRFFDERTRNLLKVKDVVILDGVFCEVPLADGLKYGGCHRTCFLFWKEDWLERADPSATGVT